MSAHHHILIVGGGTAGITVAAHLRNTRPELQVAIIEPSETHYYQPLWTLVGGGVFPREASARPMASVMPKGVTWIKDSVTAFAPEANTIQLAAGGALTYDFLVVAPGMQLRWDMVEGLEGNVGRFGICSNYSYDTVETTWRELRSFQGGKAIFTFPNTPVKCGGGPQKIMWLTEHNLVQRGIRDKAEITFVAPGGRIFGVDKYAKALEVLVEQRDIKTLFGHHLVAIDGPNRKATFQAVADGSRVVRDYDMIHVTPPMGAPDFVRISPLANAAGFVDVDKHTTQHTKFANVFALGDASSLPTAKTGAAVRKQAPVLVANMLALRDGTPLRASYDGYTSCPLVTGYGRLILAEFDYDSKPVESFPFDQAEERYSMYALKAYGLPQMYWHGMLQGRM
ncbi:MAG: NAD(P)/FAD-dependent oxidoreductase [Myxococcales bacterium]|nr:NAD(P)/FAD-dependent oxidoreductase [Myxococcales bacterium]